MRWFDRRFVFDQPIWMFPNIVERLRGTPARVAEHDDHHLAQISALKRIPAPGER